MQLKEDNEKIAFPESPNASVNKDLEKSIPLPSIEKASPVQDQAALSLKASTDFKKIISHGSGLLSNGVKGNSHFISVENEDETESHLEGESSEGELNVQ